MTRTTGQKKGSVWIWIRWVVLPLLMGAATVALISGTDRSEQEIAITAIFNHLDDDLLIVDAPRQVVRLMISGTPSALKQFESREAACQLDLAGLGRGTHTLPVMPADVSLPKSVSLSKLLTKTLTVRLETKSRKEVDVVAVLEGTPAPGFAVSAVNVTPGRILLTGTLEMLTGIDTVKTHPINLDGAAEPFKKEVPLNLPEAVRVATQPRIVVAEIDISERIVTRVLENVPLSAEGAVTDYRIDPAVITLTISGPQTIVDTVASDPTFAVTVNLKDLPPGVHALRAAIHLPIRATLVRATPEHFSVTISN